MKIREAKEREFETFYSLHKEGKKYFKKISGERVQFSKKQDEKRFSKMFGSNENHLFFIEEKGEIIGYIEFCLWKNKQPPTSYINDMIIKKEYRGKGLGKKAIKWFISYSKNKGVKRIGLGTRVENTNALELYKKMGFNIIGYNLGMKIK